MTDEKKKEDGPFNEDGTRNSLVFDSAPVVDEKSGAVLLSEHVRAEQKAAGYVPDVQPKATSVAAPPGPVGSTLQATGNLAVLTAVQAAADPDSIIQVPEATDEKDTEVVKDPAVGGAGVSPSVKQLKADA